MVATLSPEQTRAQDPYFVSQCSLAGLQHRLPLRWPTPSHTPPSPKPRYRSHYVYLGWQDLEDPATWDNLAPFDLLLRLVDFGPLRDMLAQLLGWTSARGQVPFDPVSIFLLIGWQITNAWSRAETLRNLHDPRYADYAQRFGFEPGLFPTEGGLRHWLTTLGQNTTLDCPTLVDEERCIAVAVQQLNHLLAQSVRLFLDAGLLSPEAWRKALLCPDGLLHQAASRMRCASVQESCYQPTSPAAPRPCPAQAKGRQGCDCTTWDCTLICRYATPRDPSARFVWYSGSNQRHDNPNQPTNSDPTQAQQKRGKGCYGYRSLPLQLADPARRFSLVLLDHFQPAHLGEDLPVAALLLQLSSFYPDLQVDAVAGDAGFGHDLILHIVYARLRARRLIDLHAHDTDRNQSLWPIRGYDDKGRPLCPYNYSLTANGFDFQRRRHKWFCALGCRNGASPVFPLDGVSYPPHECAHLDAAPFGLIINIGERFKDDSIRLVRDLPVGSPTWKRLYHRARNAVEARNATFKLWRLKRLPLYGEPNAKALIFQADIWLNLTTLARLVREATAATGA